MIFIFRKNIFLFVVFVCSSQNIFANVSKDEVETIIDSKVVPIVDRLNKIDSRIFQNKLMLPRIEIPYLYELVINDNAIYSRLFENKLLGKFDKTTDVYQVKSAEWWNLTNKEYTIQSKNEPEKNVKIVLYENSPEILRAKLEVLEDLLDIDTSDEKLIDRIAIVHGVVGNGDFGSDHIRFGLLTSTTLLSGDSKFITEAVVLHVYPAYSRFIPNRWDVYRRLSFMLGVGKVIYNDAKVEVSGASFIMGLGLDLIKGVSLTGGFQRQLTKSEGAASEASFSSNSPFFIGVTLNKEFWKSLAGV